MKKIALILTMLICSVAITKAQQLIASTTLTAQQLRELEKITYDELPLEVQEALKCTIYKGWESGQLFRTFDRTKFMVKYVDNNIIKIYYFDPKGKPIIGK